MIRRYLRAFIGAIRLTLSGKKPPTTLRSWMEQIPNHVNAAIMACNKAGLDEATRKNTVLTIEGRRVNLNTVLLAIKFHAEQEYPILLKTQDGRSEAAVIGTNVNDCFLLGRFIATLSASESLPALKQLWTYLENIPKDIS